MDNGWDCIFCLDIKNSVFFSVNATCPKRQLDDFRDKPPAMYNGNVIHLQA